MFTRLVLASLALALGSPLLPAQKPAEAAGPAALRVGMPAPPLSIEKWVKGSAVKGFEPGRIYVVEFWATWCAPCIASMPHLSELQREHGKDGVTVIGVTSADSRGNRLEKVEQMVTAKGDGMGYTVAWDSARTTNEAYMKAAGQSGIPCSFVVDKAGKVAYIGHPIFLDEPLAEIIAGTWDLATDPAQLDADQETFFGFYSSAEEDPKGTLAKLLAFEERHPRLAGLTDPLRFEVALAAGDYPTAYAAATRVVDRAIAAQDAPELNQIAWRIVDPQEKLERRDLDLALRAAQKAVEFTASKDANILDTLARVHAWKGDFAQAIALQVQAVQLADEEQRADLQKTLEEYKAKAG